MWFGFVVPSLKQYCLTLKCFYLMPLLSPPSHLRCKSMEISLKCISQTLKTALRSALHKKVFRIFNKSSHPNLKTAEFRFSYFL